MQVFSKFASPDYLSGDDDLTDGSSVDVWKPSLLQKKRSDLADHTPGVLRLAKPALDTGSHPPASGIWSRHSGSAARLQSRPHHGTALDSPINVSSDHSENELIGLREENMALKISCGKLEGQITGLKDAYSQLLEGVSRNIELTREDIRKIVDYITANATVLTDGSPTEDPKNLKWWNQGVWKEEKKSSKGHKKESPALSIFMEDSDGNAVPEATKTAIRRDLHSYWNEMYEVCPGELQNYTDLPFTRKQHFRNTFESKYPFLRLCDGQWKVDRLWMNYFSSWKRSRSITSADGKESTPTSMCADKGTPPLSAGSKRRLEEDEDQANILYKRQKEKARDIVPTDFHHSRALSRKKVRTKLAKDALKKSKVAPSVPDTPLIRDPPAAPESAAIHPSPSPSSGQPQVITPTPIVQEPPVASGSGMTHSSPPPFTFTEDHLPGPIVREPPVASGSGTTHSSPPPFTFTEDPLPGTQSGTVPDYYTSPILVPPEFTPIGSAAGDESVTAPSDPTESDQAPKKARGKIPYKQYICDDWVKANKGKNDKMFEKFWKKLSEVERVKMIADMKLEVGGVRR